MTTKWRLPQSYIDRFNTPSERNADTNWDNNDIVNAVQFATTDGLSPVYDVYTYPIINNIDLSETYIEINNVKYYFTLWAGLVSGFQRMSIVDDNLKLDAFLSPPIQCGIARQYNDYPGASFTGVLANGWYPRLYITYIKDETTIKYITLDIDTNTTPFITMELVPTTLSTVNTTVVGGKAVGEVSADPRTIAIRVTINGVEQALPAGSVVRNTSTGQKFLKSDGDELSYVAIELEPKPTWSWSATADAAWEVLQGF